MKSNKNKYKKIMIIAGQAIMKSEITSSSEDVIVTS